MWWWWWWWWWGIMFANVRQEMGLRGNMVKLSCWGSISGAPLKMGVEISGGRWCSGADEVVVVVMVGCCICKHAVGEGVEGQNCKIKLLGLNFKRAIGNVHGDQWGRWCSGVDEVVVVVGHCICKCKEGEHTFQSNVPD
jgi:hypothetical protein